MGEVNLTEIKTLNGYPLADTKAREDIAQLSEEIGALKSGTTQEIVLVNQIKKVVGNFISGAELGGGSPSWYATSGSVAIENNEAVFKSGSHWV
jgi:hypothetical protein